MTKPVAAYAKWEKRKNKKSFFIFAALIFASVSSFSGEKIKCIKETYTYPDYNGGVYTHEFYFNAYLYNFTNIRT